MKKIRLQPAYSWECPNCGEIQFEQVQEWDGSDKDKEEILRDFYDIEDWEELPEIKEGNGLIQAPADVVCKFCHSKYTVDFDYDDENEEDEDDIINPGFK